MTSKDRVQKHRAKLRAKQCGRLEVWLGASLIATVRQLARERKKPMGAAVQDALEFYVEEYEKLKPEGLRLTAEWTRLLAQADSPEHRPQVQEYNRQITAFNERVSRLQRTGTLIS